MAATPMMTLAELQQARINPAVAKEAHDQASLRLADVLATKATYEHKAFTLFSVYVTIAMGLFATWRALDHAGFWVAAVFFVVGAGFFAFALLDDTYGAAGSSPDMWLRPGTIDGGDNALAAMQAYLTFYHATRIDASQAGNDRKRWKVRAGVFVGVAGPTVLGVWVAGQWLKAFLL